MSALQPPVTVLVHGALQDARVWQRQTQALRDAGRTVLALSLPGHGDSPGPALPSVEAAASWLLHTLAQQGVTQAQLVGHSMGSLVVLEAAARWGANAHSLVLVGTASPMRVAPTLLQSALDAPLDLLATVAALSHGVRGEPSSAEQAQRVADSCALMRDNQLAYAQAGHGNLCHHDFSLCDHYTNALKAAAQVRCRTRIVVGERDKMTPPAAALELATALAADTQVLPGLGHALMSDAPEALTAAIQSWI